MQCILARLAAPVLVGLVIGGAALAQGGGFVFDAPEPEKPVQPTEPVAEEPQAEPKTNADDLADFTFGGGPAAPESVPVSDEERALWQDADGGDESDGYRAYLEAYPDGTYAADARAALSNLQAAADRRQGLVTACDRMAGDPRDAGLSDGADGMAMEAIDADPALWTCSRALAAAPDLPRLSYNMGRISEAQGQPIAALRSYRTALQQAIERTGSPYLPAATGILRLSEPRNASERMAQALLQLAIDGAARIEALQARGVELDAALAVATLAATDAVAEVAVLKAEIEAMTAREMELSSALSDAEADGARASSLAGEVAALSAEAAALSAEVKTLSARLEAAQAEATDATATAGRLRGLLTEAEAAAADAGALIAERDSLTIELTRTQAELEEATDAAMVAASEVAHLKAEVARLSAENATLQPGPVAPAAD